MDYLQHTLSTGFHEITLYFRTLSHTQWGILATATCTFGFLCLKSDTWRD